MFLFCRTLGLYGLYGRMHLLPYTSSSLALDVFANAACCINYYSKIVACNTFFKFMFMLCYGFKTLTLTNAVHGNMTDVHLERLLLLECVQIHDILEYILLLIEWKETMYLF